MVNLVPVKVSQSCHLASLWVLNPLDIEVVFLYSLVQEVLLVWSQGHGFKEGKG